MGTYVLVHGAWSGPHSFHLVRPLLTAEGHAVFTPSLTGLGERAHLTSPQVNLSTHVRDVVNLVVYEDLHDIVLLGHSYGGMVVTGAVDHIAERIAHVVYLDAFVPGDGQSVDILLRRPARDAGSGPGAAWLVPPLERHFASSTEAAWANARRLPHPVGCFTEPVRMRTPLERQRFGLTYIKATDDPRSVSRAEPFWEAADHAATHPRWHYHEMATNHMVQHNAPDELAGLLLAVDPGAQRDGA
jgi:pimeloyl-ACP methyl ester carboxylesterase